MKTSRTAAFFLSLLMAAAVEGAMADPVKDFHAVLPDEIGVWKKVLPTETYDKKTLYEYINGAAELFISYNFRELLTVRYAGPDEEEIVIDIFDMGDSHNAFGVFSHGREKEDGLVGQGSEYGGGLLTFWKDRYYVSIMAYPETPEKRESVLRLGRSLAGAVPAEGALPPVLAFLPEENLVRDSIRYFHHYIWLNSHFFISGENILLIDDETAAVLARYRSAGPSFHLLVIVYPDAERAQKAAGSFLLNYLPDARDGVAELPDGRWTGCRREGSRLGIVFNAPDKEILAAYLGMIGQEPARTE